MPPHQFLVQFADRAAGHEPSPLHEAKPIRDPSREGELLLDEEHREALVAVEAQDDVADLGDDVGLDTLGRLIQDEEPWLQDQRAADGELLLLAARKIAVREAVTVEGENLFSATLLDSLLLCRYLGDSAESARRCFTDAWHAVRPGLLGRAAQPPRIWRT